MQLLILIISLLAVSMTVQASNSRDAVNSSYPANYYGVDVSQYTSQAGFSCLVGQNLVYAIIRCYMSVGRPDPNCAGSVQNAHNAGMKVVDGYFFPCPTCGSAANQVNQMMSYFNQHQVKITTLWLDIEGSQYWLGNYASNQGWYISLVQACQKVGLKIGIYSSLSQWLAIFGNRGFSYGANYPLWYASYDGEPSFNGFSGFGGWSSPVAKQFSDQGSKCGVGYDINWRPSL